MLDTNIVYTYTYHLILGTLSDIRAWVYAQPYRPACDFVFQSDRRHWSYQVTTDSGWPITNCLHVSLNSGDPQTWSPFCAFAALQRPHAIHSRHALSDRPSHRARHRTTFLGNQRLAGIFPGLQCAIPGAR